MGSPGCDTRNTSWAWIDPEGGFHLCPAGHHPWAVAYFKQNPADRQGLSSTEEEMALCELGWVKLSNWAMFAAWDLAEVSPASMRTLIEKITSCDMSQIPDLENAILTFGEGKTNRYRETNLVDFVQRRGGHAAVSRLFRNKMASAPSYHTKDGIPITFKTFDDDPTDHGVNSGWVVRRVSAYVEGQEAGYLKISYIPKDRMDRFYPTIWHWLELEGNRGLVKALETGPDTLWAEAKRSFGGWGYREGKPPSPQERDEDLAKWVAYKQKGFDEFKAFFRDKPIVDYILVKDGYKRQHVGLALYTYGARWMATRFGLPLYASGIQSDEAQHAWDKMRHLKRIPLHTEPAPYMRKEKPKDPMRTRTLIDYRSMAKRVALMSCDPLALSTCWIDPKGRVHEVGPATGHVKWAESFLEDSSDWERNQAAFDKGEKLVEQEHEHPAFASAYALEIMGWLRVTSYLFVEVYDDTLVSHATWQALADMQTNCAVHNYKRDPSDSVEAQEMNLYIVKRGRLLAAKLPDFIKKYAGRAAVDALFGKVLEVA